MFRFQRNHFQVFASAWWTPETRCDKFGYLTVGANIYVIYYNEKKIILTKEKSTIFFMKNKNVLNYIRNFLLQI